MTWARCGGPAPTTTAPPRSERTTRTTTNPCSPAARTARRSGPTGPATRPNIRTVTGGADPAVGTVVCQSGSYSTSLCGITVRSTSAKYCDADGCTTYVIRATRRGQTAIVAGDSGRPVYTRPGASTATIRGITFARSGCTASRCTTLYAERYASIAGHLGVTAPTG